MDTLGDSPCRPISAERADGRLFGRPFSHLVPHDRRGESLFFLLLGKEKKKKEVLLATYVETRSAFWIESARPTFFSFGGPSMYARGGRVPSDHALSAPTRPYSLPADAMDHKGDGGGGRATNKSTLETNKRGLAS